MDNAQNERRQRMLEKVRKLLAMARDGRGNVNEEETAMRHANKIMAEFGIAEAECDIASLDAGEMSFGEAQCMPDGRAPEQGVTHRTMPGHVGTLALGVAKFTDSIVILTTTANGKTLIFRGERNDVLLARWILGVLINSINREQKASGWTTKSDATAFKTGAARELYKRLFALHAERQAMYQAAQRESNSRALVVVDRKHNQIAKLFGSQRVSYKRARSAGDSGAGIAGLEAGQRINIPAGRPIGNTAQRALN
jgi:hypothetical protein